MSRRTATLTVAGILLLVLVCVAFLLPVPYVTMQPGPTLDTLGRVKGKPLIGFGADVKTYPTSGTLDLTTVSVTSPDARVNLAQVIQGWFDPDTAVVPRDLIYPPGESPEQAVKEDRAQMSESQQTSAVAGLREAGYHVTSYVRVTSVTPNGPADGKLQVGDRVVAVDGEAVSAPEQAVRAVTLHHHPGDTVQVRVRRDGRELSVPITTEADPDDAGTPRIGVGIEAAYRLPVRVRYHVNPNIGGPSAGTMFALAIYDKLTPGALTGGDTVAGTGEISADGRVWPIGGVQQKIAGAHDAGAEVFLVPADNCEEALGAPVDSAQIRLVEVRTLHDAVTSLQALADDPDASVPTCG